MKKSIVFSVAIITMLTMLAFGASQIAAASFDESSYETAQPLGRTVISYGNVGPNGSDSVIWILYGDGIFGNKRDGCDAGF